MQSLLSAALSLALVLTSVNCFCALPAPAQQSPQQSSQQAHHQMPNVHAAHQGHNMMAEQDQGKPDCSHQACLNDCSEISALPTSPEIYQLMTRQDLDDDDDIGDALISHHPVVFFDATGPPLPTVLLARSTPINRYDTLLE